MGERATLAAARDALARAAWTEARILFRRSVDEAPTPEAWEGLGFAAYWLDDGPSTFEARLEAFRLYRERGDVRGAARVAVRLSEDYLLFRGEPAVSNGWILRAERLLAGIDPGPEHVWLLVYKAHYALVLDPQQARSLADDATQLARTFGLFDLEMLSLALGGMALVLSGRVGEGMSRLDEATAAATAGEIRDLEIIPWTCCYLVSACESVRDYKRAAQWCEIVREVAARWQMRPFSAICLAHYAGILIACGKWTEAEAELDAATQLAKETRPALLPECVVRLAELRRRQGALDEAAHLVQGYETEPAALLVLAQIALDRGDTGEGIALSDRILRVFGESNRSVRAAALEVIVRASTERGDQERAVKAAEELDQLAEVFDTSPLRASARIAEGLVAACTGDLERARKAFEDAGALFDRSEIPYEAARARVELANVLRRLDLGELADREERRSLEAFVSLGIVPARSKHDVLTPREIDVLRLIADGRTDREMAAGLSISEHTVHRHVSNILTKLGFSSRSAAVAHAAKSGLL